jgi:hypothetical protein
MPRAYLHCLRRERLDRLEAMMERYAQWRQLDLLELAMTALQRQINECGATLAKTKEADDE